MHIEAPAVSNLNKNENPAAVNMISNDSHSLQLARSTQRLVCFITNTIVARNCVNITTAPT